MKREEMTRIVNEELKHIPDDYEHEEQRTLRFVYNAVRRRDIKNNKTKEESLVYCIDLVKKDHPSWSPIYDPTF